MTQSSGQTSDAPIDQSFSAVVLFDEHFQFQVADIVDAMIEEFPGVARLSDTGKMILEVVDSEGVHDTAKGVGMASFSVECDGQEVLVNIFSLTRGQYTEFPIDAAVASAVDFPGARDAWDRHAAYLYVSASVNDSSLAGRLLAAKITTCVSATLATDPTCVAVLWSTAEGISSPKDWRRGAEQCVKDEWPLMRWLTYQRFAVVPNDLASPIQVNTEGLAHFTGREISFAPARISAGDACRFVYGAAYLLLQSRSEFKDGDTIGDQGGENSLRIRSLNADGRILADAWMLIHPSSVIDEEKTFGSSKPARSPAPKPAAAKAPHRKRLFGRRR